MDCLPQLAIFLYKEKIIAEMVIPTTEEVSSVLLKAVKEAVCADYHNLEKLIYILKESSQLTIANSLLVDYSEFIHVYYMTQFNLFHVGKAFPEEYTVMISRKHGMLTINFDAIFYTLFVYCSENYSSPVVVSRVYRDA